MQPLFFFFENIVQLSVYGIEDFFFTFLLIFKEQSVDNYQSCRQQRD